MKFKIGDTVKFKNKKDKIFDDRVSGFYCEHDGIPKEKIKHGQTIVSSNYNKEFAIIKDIYKEYYLVGYKDVHNDLVVLGFKEEDLELISSSKDGEAVTKLKRLLDL